MVASATSLMWPTGSRMYARISRPWSLGSVRNSAPLADHLSPGRAAHVENEPAVGNPHDDRVVLHEHLPPNTG